MNQSIRQNRLPFSSWEAKPGQGEPAHGYFARLVGEGYQTSARVHANELEINGRNIVLREILGELMLLPIPEDGKQSLIRWTPVWNGKFHCLSGETLRKRQVSFYNRRFCRACLAEDPHHRAWWDILDFRICPFHGDEIEQETSVGNRIKWWFPSADSAPDGEYLPRRLPRAEEPDAFEWYVLARLGFVTAQESPVLDPAPLHEVIDACSMVGRLVSNPWASTTPPSDPGDCRRGFGILRGTSAEVEAAFAGWLDKHVSRDDRNRGIHAGFGWFRWKTLSPDVNLAARRAFASVGRMGRQGLKVELPHREFTIKEAAAAIGADVRGLRKIAQQVGLAPAKPLPDERAFLTKEQMAELHAIAGDLISVIEASASLGCSQACLKELVKLGQLKGFRQTRLFGSKGHGLGFRASDIADYRQRILNIHCTGSRAQVHDISYLSRQIGKTHAQIVVDVLSGRMAITRLDRRRKGIAAWRFEAVRHKKAFRRQVGAGELRRSEAAELFGCKQNIVAVFVKAGLIKEIEGADGRTYLDPASFNAFHARFVNAKLRLTELGCTPDLIDQRLKELGIRRWHAGLPTPREVYLVERKDLEKALGAGTIRNQDPPIWKRFREELATVCPSYVLPLTLGGRDFKLKTATGSTYVMLLVDGQDLIIRKTFRKLAPREWTVFSERQRQIREEWSVFTWSKKNARGSVTAEFRIRSDWDVEAAAAALQCLYMHFKNPRKLPKG